MSAEERASLSPVELQKAKADMSAATQILIEKYDTQLRPCDVDDDAPQLFYSADQDDDGKVNKDEWCKMWGSVNDCVVADENKDGNASVLELLHRGNREIVNSTYV